MAEKTYYVGKMTCANCAQEVEDGVARLDGVRSVRVDFMSNKMTLDGDVPFDNLRTRVESLGKTLHDQRDKPTPQPTDTNAVVGFWNYLLSRRDLRLALAGGLLTVITLVGSLLGVSAAITRVLYTVSVLVTVYPIAKSGLNNLITNRRFNVNLLMTVAVFGAIVLGEYLEAATVIFLFVIGEALEGYTTDRARQSIQSLVELRPETAIRLDEDDQEQVVPVEVLRVGEQILVRPGERIPMDGRVRSGSSTVDQSPITGESVPVLKETNNEVYAGTINGDGTLTVEVTQPASDNTLSRIIQLVEDAQSKQAPSQRMINRFANWYTPSVLIMAVLVATIPPLLWSAPTNEWVYRALAMLVIACPCALVISTPVTVISAISAAARRGILIKGGVHLEALGQIQTVAFDKTGTLTEGRPQVTDYHALDCTATTDCGRCDDVLALANAVERRTTHPLAQAVVQQAKSHQLADRYAPAQDVQTVPGRGVRGNINGHTVTLGSHAWFDDVVPHSQTICDEVRAVEERGQTVMMLGVDQDVRGYITLSDTAREQSHAAMQKLADLGITTVMLTGDNASVARAIGDELGVSDIRSELLPQQKADTVEELRRTSGGGVAMVGDGINDTPALAAATVGIAMGAAGTPQALETADVTLMTDDLMQLPFAFDLSRFARRLIRQNIGLSIGVKLVFLLLAVGGLTSLWLAILADVGMLLVVVLNGMRPLRRVSPA